MNTNKKTFFLREAAFLLAPLTIFANPIGVLVRAFGFVLVVIASVKLVVWGLEIFVLQPFWYEWAGIFLIISIFWWLLGFALTALFGITRAKD